METSEKLLPTPTGQEVEHPQARLTKTGSRLTKDGKNSHSLGLADRLIYSRADSLASLFPKQGKDEARKMTAISGRKCYELFNLRNRNGSSLKMCVAYLLNKCFLIDVRTFFEQNPQ